MPTCTNKPNFLDVQMHVSSKLTKTYQRQRLRQARKNKPNEAHFVPFCSFSVIRPLSSVVRRPAPRYASRFTRYESCPLVQTNPISWIPDACKPISNKELQNAAPPPSPANQTQPDPISNRTPMLPACAAMTGKSEIRATEHEPWA